MAQITASWNFNPGSNCLFFYLSLFYLSFSEKTVHRFGGQPTDFGAHVGRPGPDVGAVRNIGPSHLVGIFLGHNGAGHVLCHLRYRHGRVRLLRTHQTGTYYDMCIGLWILCSKNSKKYALKTDETRTKIIKSHKILKKKNKKQKLKNVIFQLIFLCLWLRLQGCWAVKHAFTFFKLILHTSLYVIFLSM